MDRKGWTRIDILESLQSLAMGIFWLIRTERSLIPCPKSIAECPVAKELNEGIVGIGNHSAYYHNSDIVEPECVNIGVHSSKERLQEFRARLTAIPWCHNVDKAVVEHAHVEYGDENPFCFFSYICESQKSGHPNQDTSDYVGVDNHALREYSGIQLSDRE